MSKRIEELLEEYSSNRKQYIGEKHFKFLRKVFKAFKEVGALNISFIYYTLNSNGPKIMDSEFMKAYIESMLKDNHTLINIFTGYWENNRGLELTEGLNNNFNMILKEEEVFAALIANNELEKVLQLLSITYYRIKSLTETTSEDLFYSKCLSDYEREDFKNAVSGLRFFGFNKRAKEEISATSGLQSFGFSLAESKADNIRRESLKKMREEGKAYNQKLKDEGKGFFERIKLNYKFDQEQIDKIQKEYYKNIEKFSKAEGKDNKIAPLSKEEIENYLALNKEAFNAIKEAYKKFSKIEEFAPVEKQAPDDEWGSWDSFVDGKTSFYSIALVSWDQEDWLDNGRALVKEANNILSKKGIGEKILTIGGDGDEGIIDVDIRGAEINFDKLK